MLQRLAGNAAVGRRLARRSLAQSGAELKDAAERWQHAQFLTLLIGLDTDGERRVALSTVSLERLGALREFVGRHRAQWPDWVDGMLGTARGERLDRDYLAAVARASATGSELEWGAVVMLLSAWPGTTGGGR